MSTTSFDPMRPDEVEVFAVDFKRRVATGVTLSSPAVKAVAAGDATEAAIPAMVSGVAGVDGTVVSQLVSGVAEGAYTLIFSVATSQGETLIEARDLVVQRDLT